VARVRWNMPVSVDGPAGPQIYPAQTRWRQVHAERGVPADFQHVIRTFFATVATVPKMLHRPTLLASIQLAPSSPNFPVS